MVTRPKRVLFVEGGGSRNKSLQAECRRAFRMLLEKAGLVGNMPRIIACGGRANAYSQFRAAISTEENPEAAFLLVDPEEPVTTDSPWSHIKDRKQDGWRRPNGAEDCHLHFMVQCMEAWFLADREALQAFFGNGYREERLPSPTINIEDVGKQTLFKKLKSATRNAKYKGAYEKNAHSFKLLANLDPGRIRKASPWADRFFRTLARLPGGDSA